ncbi:hypothetical protein PsorP6_001168 [Peronosclerospora sorghi]|uniref:Uncharacterized protein n=1 Tax=Peronosclerospora sorghi TaxID=230839 RepID=A0ACC0WTQ2_9STRA|nr:hypothetical protein PsorP6_001168 [Peronosclerospora sorghi]
MATLFIRRGVGTATEDNMLSDITDDGSPLSGDVYQNRPKNSSFRSSNDSFLDSLVGDDAILHRIGTAQSKSSTDETTDTEDKVSEVEREEKNKTSYGQPVQEQERIEKLIRSQSSRAASLAKKSARKKWYSDSDEEEEQLTMNKDAVEEVTKKGSISGDRYEQQSSYMDADIAGSVVGPRGTSRNESTPTHTRLSRLHAQRIAIDRKEIVSSAINSEGGVTSSTKDIERKKTNISKLKTNTRTMSPFGREERGFDQEVLESPATINLSRAQFKRETSAALEGSTKETLAIGNTGIKRPAKVQTGRAGSVSPIIINRHTDRLKYSASGSDYSGSPRLAISSNDEVSSPGLRKVPGVSPGKPGSGVLLEGWLRQKQRRGIKGPKKWNLRYFVLYARSNEVRYYADVVQSAWGPIPLGEVGAISLRLIQRISKLSHPKYKGCRFDITCRNCWGTYGADDYISTDDEDAGSPNVHIKEKTGTTALKQEKGGTSRTSRVYSLVAESPQVTVSWVRMLDSLLTRSANSPRPDLGSPREGTHATSTANGSGRIKKPRAVACQRSSALDAESSVLKDPGENIPKAAIYAMHFIFDSTPGIETENFYEVEPDSKKLKTALKFLNGFASEAVTRKPTVEELDELLDACTAGAVVRLWLKQLDEPLIPFAMYDDFAALAREAQSESFDLHRNLRALLEALPKKNLYVLLIDSFCCKFITGSVFDKLYIVCWLHSTSLACLLFHLNDVNVYSSKNGMDATRLAHLFTKDILHPPTMSPECDNWEAAEMAAVRHVVKELITNVDTFIDEKEAQVVEDNQL